MSHPEKYRVRRGLFGGCILQYLKEHNSRNTWAYIGEPYFRWADVPYNAAPRALKSEIGE